MEEGEDGGEGDENRWEENVDVRCSRRAPIPGAAPLLEVSLRPRRGAAPSPVGKKRKRVNGRREKGEDEESEEASPHQLAKETGVLTSERTSKQLQNSTCSEPAKSDEGRRSPSPPPPCSPSPFLHNLTLTQWPTKVRSALPQPHQHYRRSQPCVPSPRSASSRCFPPPPTWHPTSSPHPVYGHATRLKVTSTLTGSLRAKDRSTSTCCVVDVGLPFETVTGDFSSCSNAPGAAASTSTESSTPSTTVSACHLHRYTVSALCISLPFVALSPSHLGSACPSPLFPPHHRSRFPDASSITD